MISWGKNGGEVYFELTSCGSGGQRKEVRIPLYIWLELAGRCSTLEQLRIAVLNWEPERKVKAVASDR